MRYLYSKSPFNCKNCTYSDLLYGYCIYSTEHGRDIQYLIDKKVRSDFSDPLRTAVLSGSPPVSEPPWNLARVDRSALRRRQGAHDGSPDALEPHETA